MIYEKTLDQFDNLMTSEIFKIGLLYWWNETKQNEVGNLYFAKLEICTLWNEWSQCTLCQQKFV